jgi:hypothetical protein
MPGPVVPAGAVPATVEEATAWAAATRVTEPTLHRFRWLYVDQQASAGGRGSARLVPGDSIRLDMLGPLGAGRGAAFVVGDSARWAEPEEEVGRLVPNYPLLWGMLGVVRLPAAAGEVVRYQDDRLIAWRFVAGTDTVEVARFIGPPGKLVVDVRQGGRRLGRVETVFGPQGALKSSRIIAPGGPARLDVNYVSSTRTTGFPADTWDRPEPPAP